MNEFCGLTEHEVLLRKTSGQSNDVHISTSRSLKEILVANAFTRFNAILGTLFLVVLIAGSPADGLFGLVLLTNSTVGVAQEWLAKKKLDALSLLHSPRSRVIRDGKPIDVFTADIVRDDVVLLSAGDQVPVDGKVLRSNSLEINEANLTGESDSVHKSDNDIIMSGTIVTAGSGIIRAESVGIAAYAHRLAAEARIFTRAPSEIQRGINTLLRWVTWVLVIATPVQMWSQLRQDLSDDWRNQAIRIVSGLVGLVPEGLVLLATLAFLSAAVSLTRHNVLVQELPAVEVLARVSVVCLDKTGTLTSGEIVLDECCFLEPTKESQARLALSSLSNDSAANTTQKAIAAVFGESSSWNLVEHIPFDSSRKWKASRFDEHGSWFLGAPEVLLPDTHQIRPHINELAETGRRVLLLATSQTNNLSTTIPDDLLPVALLILREEIRSDAAETLKYFADQGVRVMVLSGDNPHTVAAIARSVGLHVTTPVDARLIGSSVEELQHITHETVLGRVSPEQKRNIVGALQSVGEVVAMTGDGVNDALALKRADIGIAMDNAAPATKAVAQLILLDGKFSHLPHVLSEGRRVIGNIERVAQLFVAKNAMSMMAILLVAMLGASFPILPRQMTLLSSVTIGIPAFFLALAPNARLYRPGFIRRVIRFAVPFGTVAGISVVVADKWTGDTTGTAATLTALICFFGVLLAVSLPVTPQKIVLLMAMGLLATLSMSLPIAQQFFQFSVSTEIVWKSILVSIPTLLIVIIRQNLDTFPYEFVHAGTAQYDHENFGHQRRRH